MSKETVIVPGGQGIGEFLGLLNTHQSGMFLKVGYGLKGRIMAMGGLAILFWDRKSKSLKEKYLNLAMRNTYLEAVSQAGGFEDWDKALIWKCLNCMGARLRADGFFGGNKKALDWLILGKGLNEAPGWSLGKDSQGLVLDISRHFEGLENKGFAWVVFKDNAVSCLHLAKCIYDKGVCLSCGKESIPYISLGTEWIRKGWAPALKNHKLYCLGCYQSEKGRIDKASLLSHHGFSKEKPKLRVINGEREKKSILIPG